MGSKQLPDEVVCECMCQYRAAREKSEADVGEERRKRFREYLATPEGQARMRRYYENRKARHANDESRKSKWCAENKDKIRAYVVEYRAKIRAKKTVPSDAR